MELTSLLRKYHFEGLTASASATLSANIVSFLQLGCTFGAFLAYPFADKYGRKPSLIVAAFIAFVGIVMQFAASGILGVMYAARFVFWTIPA